MNAYVGITDFEWYQRLAARAEREEVNFWRPGGKAGWRRLAPGELFLFKLHAPRHFVVGGGRVAHFTKLPVSLAWDAFGEANGARSLTEMRARIERYRREPAAPHDDYPIGCILLEPAPPGKRAARRGGNHPVAPSRSAGPLPHPHPGNHSAGERGEERMRKLDGLGVQLAVMAVFLLPAGAEAVTIRFAQQVTVVQNVSDPANALGAPDAAAAGFNGPSPTFATPGEAVFSDFSVAQTYSTAGLAVLLGVSETALLAADAITVEVNGLPSFGVPDSYETTTHTFDDGVGARSVSNVYLGAFGAEIISRASVSSAAYDAFFGTTSPPAAGGVRAYAFLLFDFDAAAGAAVDALAPGFSWRVLGTDLGVGSPDPDFFGVLVPEPGALALLALGAALAVALARARRA